MNPGHLRKRHEDLQKEILECALLTAGSSSIFSTRDALNLLRSTVLTVELRYPYEAVRVRHAFGEVRDWYDEDSKTVKSTPELFMSMLSRLVRSVPPGAN